MWICLNCGCENRVEDLACVKCNTGKRYTELLNAQKPESCWRKLSYFFIVLLVIILLLCFALFLSFMCHPNIG